MSLTLWIGNKIKVTPSRAKVVLFEAMDIAHSNKLDLPQEQANLHGYLGHILEMQGLEFAFWLRSPSAFKAPIIYPVFL